MDRETQILSLKARVHITAAQLCRRLPKGTATNDLIGEGWLGAIRAVDRYVPGGEATLSTFPCHGR